MNQLQRIATTPTATPPTVLWTFDMSHRNVACFLHFINATISCLRLRTSKDRRKPITFAANPTRFLHSHVFVLSHPMSSALESTVWLGRGRPQPLTYSDSCRTAMKDLLIRNCCGPLYDFFRQSYSATSRRSQRWPVCSRTSSSGSTIS